MVRLEILINHFAQPHGRIIAPWGETDRISLFKKLGQHILRACFPKASRDRNDGEPRVICKFLLGCFFVTTLDR